MKSVQPYGHEDPHLHTGLITTHIQMQVVVLLFTLLQVTHGLSTVVRVMGFKWAWTNNRTQTSGARVIRPLSVAPAQKKIPRLFLRLKTETVILIIFFSTNSELSLCLSSLQDAIWTVLDRGILALQLPKSHCLEKALGLPQRSKIARQPLYLEEQRMAGVELWPELWEWNLSAALAMNPLLVWT